MSNPRFRIMQHNHRIYVEKAVEFDYDPRDRVSFPSKWAVAADNFKSQSEAEAWVESQIKINQPPRVLRIY